MSCVSPAVEGQFEDRAWLCDLAFLVDVTEHMNEHNFLLQGKDVLVPDLLICVKAFECKMCLWEIELQQRNYAHFFRLAALSPPIALCRHCTATFANFRGDFSSASTPSAPARRRCCFQHRNDRCCREFAVGTDGTSVR